MRVPSGSMEPTIEVGDQIWVTNAAYDLRVPFMQKVLAKISDPERGDVVVFNDPQTEGRLLIKRLIGLPGDTVVIQDGWVTINGAKVAIRPEKEPFLFQEVLPNGIKHWIKRNPDLASYSSQRAQSFNIPVDQYLFLGDARDNSADGRYFGLISRKELVGRAERILANATWNKGEWPVLRPERIGERLQL